LSLVTSPQIDKMLILRIFARNKRIWQKKDLSI